jgi:xanthine dehydrogenase/oxidase
MEEKVVAEVPTHVLSLSGVPHREDINSKPPLLVIIPGSPGMGHFYVPFASKLFDLGLGRYDVSVVSHAGHSPGHYKGLANHEAPEENMRGGLSLQQQRDWYSLEDQITHKLAFIEKEGEGRDSIVLIGHSIGCWMILHMLQRMDTKRIAKIFLLFPTIEKMSASPNGQSMLQYLWSWLRKPFTGLVWLSSRFIPNLVKEKVLSMHFHTTPREHLQPIVQGVINIDEKSIYNILQMAKQEMSEVNDLPLHSIDRNVDKISFYYGVGDNWNMETSYRDMAARFPGKDVHLCEQNIQHAFVECSSDEMAEYVHSKLLLS